MDKPLESVEAYFKQQEIDLIKDMRERHAKETEQQDDEELQHRHYMHCPKCGQLMKSTMIETIEVDKCSNCLGIYFDNGELEQLFEIEFEKRKTIIHKIFGV